MGRYSQEYGLEDDKNNPDGPTEAGKRTYFCPFSQLEYKRGFYLGFAHFILSLPAAHHMLKVEPELAGSNDRWEECFRCKATPTHLHYYHSTTMGICPACAKMGWEYLRRPPEVVVAPPPPPPPVPKKKAVPTGQLSLF